PSHRTLPVTLALIDPLLGLLLARLAHALVGQLPAARTNHAVILFVVDEPRTMELRPLHLRPRRPVFPLVHQHLVPTLFGRGQRFCAVESPIGHVLLGHLAAVLFHLIQHRDQLTLIALLVADRLGDDHSTVRVHHHLHVVAELHPALAPPFHQSRLELVLAHVAHLLALHPRQHLPHSFALDHLRTPVHRQLLLPGALLSALGRLGLLQHLV